MGINDHSLVIMVLYFVKYKNKIKDEIFILIRLIIANDEF